MTDTLQFTDDFTGAVNTPWNTTNWGANNVGGGVINLDGSGHGRMSTTASASASRVTALSADSDDYDLLVSINRSGTSASANKFFIAPVADYVAAASNTFPFTNGVWIEATLSTSPTATMKSARGGVITTGPTVSLATFATGVYQRLRLRKEGNIFSVKAWDASLAEPASWTQTWDMGTNAPVTGSGWRRPFIGMTSSTGSSSFLLVDDVSASTIYNSVSAGYTAQAMTATSLSPNAVVTTQTIISRSYAAQASTLSALAVDPTIQTVKADKTTTVTNLNSNYINNGNTTVALNQDNLSVGSTNEIGLITKSSLGLPSDAKIGTAYLNFRVYILSDPSMTFQVQSIDAPYDPNTVVWSNKPAMGAIQTAFQTFNTSGQNGSFEIGAIVKAMQAGTAYGLALVGNNTGRGSIYTNSANPLTLTINYESSGLAQVAVVPLTGSGLAVDPTFTNVTPVNIGTGPFTGSAVMTQPVLSLIKHTNLDVSPFTANAEGPLGGFAVPATLTAPALTASGTALDASVTGELNSVVRATAANSSGFLMAPVEAQNSLDDPYYNRLMKTTTDADFWYRLDEAAGSVAKDARGNTAKDADLVGAYSFGVYGPEGRRSMHFDNGYFSRRWAQPNYTGVQGQSPYDDVDTTTWSFETVIRTTDKNGILAYGLDRANPVNELGTIPIFRNAITVKNGKVSVDWNYKDRSDSQYSLSGIKDIADGQWHHVVVSFNQGNEFDLGSGLRIVIDGKLDIRRRFTSSTPGLWAAPDTYFGMPDAWRTEGMLFPWQKNFVGDVMEVTFRVNHDITSDQTIDLYYDAMGIVPIRVQPATGVGTMQDAKGKGNRQRVLVLYTKWNSSGLVNPASAGDERNSPSGWDSKIPDEFDHDIQIGRIYEPGAEPWEDLVGFRVVPVSIMREDSTTTGPYRDPVTDLPRLLNLQEDLDLGDYSTIIFRNWPDEGADLEVFKARGYTNQNIDDFLGSVKQAVVDGMSLEVTNPNLAYRLGLINGAKPVPMMRNRKGTTETDLRGATLDMWTVGDNEETAYLDLHANNWHRVVADIENLTNGPTDSEYEHITEAFITQNLGEDGKINNKWAYKLSDEPLKIGDEIIDPVDFFTRINAYTRTYTNPAAVLPWDRYVWAITPDGLNVGTPLYKFNSQMWDRNVLVDNPYRDYIGGAVVQPGDVWGGQQVAGKIFMNFAEAPWDAQNEAILSRQIVPPNSEIQFKPDWEDEASRDWDYTYYRVQYVGGTTPNPSTSGFTTKEVKMYQDKSGKWYAEESQSKGQDTGTALPTINIVEKYPTESVLVPNWFIKGMAWLATKEEIPSGSVVIRTTAATATGSIPEPQVTGQKSVTIGAQTASSIGVLVSPREAHDPDVTVIALPALAEGRMTGYGKTITVAPFEASGELIDNFDLISAAGEQVVVYLHYADAEVYLKEENK